MFPLDPALRHLAYPRQRLTQLVLDLHQLLARADAVYRTLRGPAAPYRLVAPAEVLRALRGRPPESAAPAWPLLAVARAYYAAAVAVPDESRLAKATLLTYRSRLRTLERYLTQQLRTPQLLAAAVDVPWCRRYERWCASPAGGHGPASLHKQINFLQLVLAYAVAEGWLAGPPVLHGYAYQTRLAPTVPVALPLVLVQELEAAWFSGAFDEPAVERAVAGWLFCLYTGLSWVDYGRVARALDQYLGPGPGGVRYLRLVRQKMRRRKPGGFAVPLAAWPSHTAGPAGVAPAEALLAHYRGRLPFTVGRNANRLLGRVARALWPAGPGAPFTLS